MTKLQNSCSGAIARQRKTLKELTSLLKQQVLIIVLGVILHQNTLFFLFGLLLFCIITSFNNACIEVHLQYTYSGLRVGLSIKNKLRQMNFVNVGDFGCGVYVCHILTTNRCKENNPPSKLSPEELDSIAEMEESIKDKTNAFFEMEAFLPKKNGYKSVL